MKTRTDIASVLLASFVLELLAMAGFLLFREKTAFADYPGIIPLILVIVILLVQILVLFRRKKMVEGTLVCVDLDEKGIPQKIFETPETGLIRFCRKNFAMVFTIEYWPELRKRLLAEKQEDSPNGRLAEQLFDEGSALPDGDFVAFLEYTDKRGSHATLAALSQMPTPAEGAMRIIRANFTKTLVFRNALELAAWESQLPEEKKPPFRNQRNHFLKRRLKALD